MKETLVSATQTQLSNLSAANAEELGAAMDMIKDLAEAIYYCEIVKSMKDSNEKQQQPALMYFHEKYPYYPERDRDRDRRGDRGRMYYNEPSSSNNNNGNRNYEEFEYYRSPYDGRSPERRRTYMESRHSNDKGSSMKELERYIQDLASDIVEMMQDSTTEERQMLGKKLAMLSTKIQEV